MSNSVCPQGKWKLPNSRVALLIVGILAVATSITLVFPIQQSPNTITATASSPQEQSAYITSTTTLGGGATLTEFLVNTSIQFPIGNHSILASSISNSVQLSALIILLCLSTVMILLSFSVIHKT